MIVSGITSIERQAVRIMFILYYCHDEDDRALQLNIFPDEKLYSIGSETKLQKLDFWVRCPDHLAAALLRICESNKISPPDIEKLKDEIRQMFQDEEPLLRRIPMHKYLRGAYEPLDEVMSFLSSRRLAHRYPTGQSRYRTRYVLMHKGIQTVDNLLKFCPESAWYARRCKLIRRYFGELSGFTLRKLQYLEQKYDAANYHELIDSVEAEVRRRFEQLFGEPL